MLTENLFDKLVERVERIEKTLEREGVQLYEAPKAPAPVYPKAVAQHIRFETNIHGHMAFFTYECTCGQEHSASALVGREARYTTNFSRKTDRWLQYQNVGNPELGLKIVN